jgi:hypothetical protein
MNTPPRTNRAAGTPLPAGTLPSDDDTDMTRTYVRVVILEAAVIAALWLLGRAFS